MGSVQLQLGIMTESVLVTLWVEVEEVRRFLNEERDPMTSKELNKEICEAANNELHPSF